MYPPRSPGMDSECGRADGEMGACAAAMDVPQRRAAPRLVTLLHDLQQADDGVRRDAVEALLGIARERMQSLAHRMLRGFRGVRRWDDTDDVVQESLLRLHRAMETVTITDAKHFMALAAVQVRRQLLDLARHHASPSSFAANHDSDGGDGPARVSTAIDPVHAPPDALAAWTRFHEVVAGLPDEERQLFELVWYLGAEQADIAEILGCSTRTVRRRWEATKQRLVGRLGNALPE